MGRGAEKKRQDATKAKRKAITVEPGQPVASTAKSGTRSSKTCSVAAEVATEPVPREAEEQSMNGRRPIRKSAKAAEILLQEIQLHEDNESGSTTAFEEFQAEEDYADDEDVDEYEEDIDIHDVAHSSAAEEISRVERTPGTARATAAATTAKISQATAAAAKVKLPSPTVKSNDDSSSESDAPFEFTLEVFSVAKQTRDISIVSSEITFFSLQEKIARALNIYPQSLHLQYRFSSDPKDTLPCDLTTHGHFNTLMMLLRNRSTPGLTASGKRSTRKLKAYTLQVFTKGDSPFAGESKSAAKAKADSVAKEQTKSAVSAAHEQRIEIRHTLSEKWACDIHSLPDKPSLCFKNPTTSLCHPITENNVYLWASLHINDPVAYLLDKPPVQINVLGNSARGRPTTKPAVNVNEPAAFPYGCYPPPFMTPAMYYSSMGFPQIPPGLGFLPPQGPTGFLPPHGPTTFLPPQGPTPPTATAAAVPLQAPRYLGIQEWVEYCDRHPECAGAHFNALLPKFQGQGFRYVNQLTGSRVTIDNLSEWLSVGPGTADLIIRYAEEDCQLIAAGEFRMELARGLVAAAEA